MSTTAVTDGHCYHQSQETVAVKRALMESAARRILLIDHTKFSKNGLYQLAPLTAFDLVIVDARTEATILADMQTAGVPFQVVGTASDNELSPNASRTSARHPRISDGH